MIRKTKESIFLDSKLIPLIENRRIIKEGLITTYPVDASQRILSKLGYDVDFMEDAFNRGYIDLDDMAIISSLQLNSVDISNKEKFFNLIKTINTLGYYISFASIAHLNKTIGLSELQDLIKLGSSYNVYKDQLIDFIIEAKYDSEVSLDSLPTHTLYHITSQESWKKIQKQGLSPRFKEKISLHPDRIYLATSIRATKLLMSMMSTLANAPDVILKIDITNLKSPRFRAFIDPNASNAIYTYSNIPPQNIKKV